MRKDDPMAIRLALVIVIALCLAECSETCEAQTPTVVRELGDALRSRLTMHTRADGQRVYVAHCRLSDEGCEERIDRLAALFVDAGNAHGIDPWLLAAISLKESGLHSGAVGSRGERGLMQLHPESRWGRTAIRECDAEGVTPAMCDRVMVHAAAELMARALERCAGDMGQALGAYNTGSCTRERGAVYAARVQRFRRELHELAAQRTAERP